MTRIENENQYEWAVQKVEELLPLVNDETPESDPNYILLLYTSPSQRDAHAWRMASCE